MCSKCSQCSKNGPLYRRGSARFIRGNFEFLRPKIVLVGIRRGTVQESRSSDSLLDSADNHFAQYPLGKSSGLNSVDSSDAATQ